MRKIFLFALLFTSFNAFTQVFDWARRMGATTADNGAAIVVDDAGNVYSTGSFTGTVDFDPGPGTANLASSGSDEIYVQKLDSAGNFVWAKKMGGIASDIAKSIALDDSGNVYTCGYFNGTADFDPGALAFNLTSAGGNDMYISKLNNSGFFLWAVKVGGTTSDVPNSIAISDSNDVYVTGSFQGTVDFDPGAATSNLTSAGVDDIFVLKLNSGNSFIWAQKIGGTGQDISNALALDGLGTVYFTGSFQMTVDFDPGAGTVNLASSGTSDIFVCKLSSAGLYSWAGKVGSSSNDVGYSIALNSGSQMYVTGSFKNTADFDPGAGTVNLTSTGLEDIFVLKLDGSGAYQWAVKMDGRNTDIGKSVSIDSSGFVYIASYFADTVDFDPGVAVFNQISAGANDIALTKLDASGNHLWSKRMGSTGNDVPAGIFADVDGNTFTTGSFSGVVDFNPDSAAMSNLSSAGLTDIFIQKLQNCALLSAPDSISGTTTVCAGTSQTYVVTPVAGATSYNWGLPAGWSGSSTSDTITAVAGTSGTITVNAVNACGNSTPVSLAVVVNPIPATPDSIYGSVLFCSGSTQLYYVEEDTLATAYTWTLPAGWTGSSIDDSISVVTSATAGYITVSAANSCGSSGIDSLLVSITSSPAMPDTIYGPLHMCVGTTDTFSIDAVPGATSYTWFLPGGWTGTSTSTSIVATAGVGSGLIFVRANNSCGSSAYYSLSLTSDPVLSAPSAISGPLTLCTGLSGTYSISAVPGASSYNWTLPAGWSGSSSFDTIYATAGATGGTVSVTAENTCGISPPQTLSVTVNPAPPSLGSIIGDDSICAGTINTFSVVPVAGALSYTWTLPSGFTGSSTFDSIVTTSGSLSGTISVLANFTCGAGAPQTLFITVDTIPAAPGSIFGPTNICASVNADYYISPIANADSYNWSLPAGWPGSSSTDSISTTSAANSGTISVTATNYCGTGPAATLSVTVDTLMSAPAAILGPDSVCASSTNWFYVNAMPGALSYIWSLPPGWTGSSTSDSILATATSSGGTISVQAVNGCGPGATQTSTIGILNIPVMPAISISGADSVCQSTTNVYSISLVPGATSYSWTLPAGWSGSSVSNSINATAATVGGIISVTADNSCGSSAALNLSVLVDTVPSAPDSIFGLDEICVGTANDYFVLPVTGALSYTWTLPASWTGSSSLDLISTTAGISSGLITVTADNACGSSAVRDLFVTVNDVPALPSAISGPTSLCAGATATYYVAAAAGVSSYNWTLPLGWIGSSTDDSITVTAGSFGGNILVSATNLCGSSADRLLAVTVNSTPAAPTGILGPAIICEGALSTYTVSAVAGAATYNWTLPAGWTGSSTTNTINLIANGVSGVISVTAANSCGTSGAATLSITVNPVPVTPGAISGPASVCGGSPYTYSVPLSPDAVSYTWILPGGWSGSSTTNVINATPGSSSGNITVVANNACGSSPVQTLFVAAHGVPATPASIAGPTSICDGSTNTYSVSPVAGATSYVWTLPGSWTGTSTTTSIVATAGSTDGYVTVAAKDSCGSSLLQLLAVNVNLVDPTITQSGATLTANRAGAVYQWVDCSTGFSNIAGATAQSFHASVNGTYACKITVGGCTVMSECITVNNVGLGSDEANAFFNLSPNPSSGFFAIDIPEAGELQLFDLLGNELMKANCIQGRNEFDISHYVNGIYLLRIRDMNVKLIKE